MTEFTKFTRDFWRPMVEVFGGSLRFFVGLGAGNFWREFLVGVFGGSY